MRNSFIVLCVQARSTYFAPLRHCDHAGCHCARTTKSVQTDDPPNDKKKKKPKYCPKTSGKKRKAVRKWRNKMCGILSRNEAFVVVSVRTQNPNRNRRSRIGKKLPKGLRGIRVWNMADMDIFRAILLVDCKILGAMINTWTGTPHYIL